MLTMLVKQNPEKSKFYMVSPTYHIGVTEDTMRRLHIDPNSMEQNCFLFDVKLYHSKQPIFPEPVRNLVGSYVNLNQMDHLLKRLEGFSQAEMIQLNQQATPDMDAGDLINLCLGIEGSTYHYEGRNFPPFRSKNDLAQAKLTAKANSDLVCYVNLPLANYELKRSLELIGCESPADCDIEYTNISLSDEMMKQVQECGELRDADALCSRVWWDRLCAPDQTDSPGMGEPSM